MDIIEKVKDKVEDKDLQIELLESIADEKTSDEEMISKKEYDDLKVEFELLTKKYEDLQDKYISRFGDSKSDKPNDVVADDKIEEKEVIDVKDIFNEEKED